MSHLRLYGIATATALLVAGTACRVITDDDLAARIDQDADGHPAEGFGGDDCDDAAADVFPGAVEVPYDGVDQNCDPADNDDSDGDSYVSAAFGGDDCDDTDSTVHPGANEVWYDGVDQDCSGGADDDRDGDGFAATETGGADCDDDDPEVHPKAEEVWYDGLDQDCDGADDFDQDGDGDPSWEWGGGDCADADPAVNADAIEVCDGVDNDCDGTIDGSEADGVQTFWRDQDTDGHGDASDPITECEAPLGYAEDDTDCDDTDASTYPGAPEQCDAADHDCDGIAWCSVAIDGDTTLRGSAGDEAGTALAFGGDLTGDGVGDIIIGAPYAEASGGTATGVVFLARGTLSGTVAVTTNTRIDGANRDGKTGAAVDALGDADGDGDADLIIGSPLDYGGAGEATIAFGPISSGTTLGGAGVRVRGDVTTDQVGTRVRAAGDLTGDGWADAWVVSPAAQNVLDEPNGAVYLLPGPVGTAGTVVQAADVAAATLEAPSAGVLDDADVAVGDVDGDGDGDTLISAPTSGAGALYIVYSPAPTGTFAFVDNADVTVTGLADGDAFGRSVVAVDLDGDGVAEVVAGAPGNDDAETDAGAVFLLSGAASSAGDATAVLRGEAAGDAFGAALSSAGDLDGDTVVDLVVGAPASSSAGKEAGAAYVFFGPFAGTLGPDDAGARILGVDGRAGSVVLGGHDVDGDGWPDLVISAPTSDAPSGDAGNIFLLDGATFR